jgi:hypothetical protein
MQQEDVTHGTLTNQSPVHYSPPIPVVVVVVVWGVWGQTLGQTDLGRDGGTKKLSVLSTVLERIRNSLC